MKIIFEYLELDLNENTDNRISYIIDINDRFIEAIAPYFAGVNQNCNLCRSCWGDAVAHDVDKDTLYDIIEFFNSIDHIDKFCF